MTTMSWRDTRTHYGRISRWLHWVTGALLLWQLGGRVAQWLVGAEPWVQVMNSTHRSLGSALMVLLMLRALWGLYNLSRRPRHDAGLMLLAGFSHLLLYALMLLVPALGLLMTWASGQAFAPWHVPLFSAGESHATTAALAAQWHVWLGWSLVVLVIGHILMALVWHLLIRRDATLRRMIGPPPRSEAADTASLKEPRQ